MMVVFAETDFTFNSGVVTSDLFYSLVNSGTVVLSVDNIPGQVLPDPARLEAPGETRQAGGGQQVPSPALSTAARGA